MKIRMFLSAVVFAFLCSNQVYAIESEVTELELFDRSLDDYGRRAEVFNDIGLSDAFLWMNVKDEDGNLYFIFRSHGVGETLGYMMTKLSTGLWENPTIIRGPYRYLNYDSLYYGVATYERNEEGTAHVVSHDNTLYPPLTISMRPGQIHWTDADLLDLTMTRLGPALKFRVPGEPDDVGYTSEHMIVEGTFQGKSVTGYGGYDRSYTEYGVTWNQCKVLKYLEQGWLVWAGLNENGDYEHGWAVMGPDSWGVAGFVREGEAPVVTDQVTRVVEAENNGGVLMPTKVTVSFEGRTFEFIPTRQIGFPVQLFPIDWVFGETKEVGGPDLVEGFSMIEIYGDDFYELDCTDADEDGYAVDGGVCGEVDCDDSDPAIHPGATETRGDGIDSNCNGYEACGTMILEGQPTMGLILANLALYLVPLGGIFGLRRRMTRTTLTC